MIVGGSPGDVVDHEGAGGAAVVGARDSPESLLSCGVPDLQLDLLPGDLDDSRTELNADGVRAVRHD